MDGQGSDPPDEGIEEEEDEGPMEVVAEVLDEADGNEAAGGDEAGGNKAADGDEAGGSVAADGDEAGGNEAADRDGVASDRGAEGSGEKEGESLVMSDPATWEPSKQTMNEDSQHDHMRITAKSEPDQNDVKKIPFQIPPTRFKPDTPAHAKEIFAIIQSAAESNLFQFDVFILNLPIQLNTASKAITMDDLFKRTASDNGNELNRLAFDPSGNQKRLDQEQIKKIRKDGYFEVQSQRYPGRSHVWRLSKFFAKGEKRMVKKFWYDMAAAVKLIMIGCTNRLFTLKPFSIGRGFLSCLKGLYYFIDLAVGIPYRKKDLSEMNSHMSETKLNFILKEIELDEEEIDDWAAFKRSMDFDLRLRRQRTDNSILCAGPKCPTKVMIKEKGLSVNAKLLHPGLLSFFRTHVIQLYRKFVEKNEKAYRSFALKKIQEWEKQELDSDSIVEKVNEELAHKFEIEFKEEVFNPSNWSIESHDVNHYIVKNFGGKTEFEEQVMATLNDYADHQKVAQILADQQREQAKAKDIHVKAVEEHLEKRHQILMKVSTWRRRRMAKEEERYVSNNEEKYHQQTIKQLQAEGFDAAAHLFDVERDFEIQHKASEEKKFKKTAPLRESYIKLKRKIWLPQNWIVTNCWENGGRHYQVEKKYTLKVDRKLPFWRWTAFFIRTWVWMMNMMLYLLLLIPFCSSFSLRALFSPREFLLSGFDHHTGKIIPDEDHRTRTLCSRLYDLWHHVFKYRRKFESGPDTGLLGRNCSRPLNVFWNYFVKGFCGTLILLTLFPVFCVVISFTSLALGLMCPILVPIISLSFSLFQLLIYDFDSPHGKRRILPLFQTYIFVFLCEGIFQMIFAFLAGVVFIPIVALFTFLMGCFWALSRTCWDKCCLYTVLKPRGRVPATDSWVAIRVSGPGLASSFLYQAKPQTILAAIKIQIELDLLEAYEKSTIKEIEKPGKEFDEFFRRLSQPLFSGGSVNPELRELITIKERLLKEELSKKMKARRTKLVRNGIPRDVCRQVKLRADDLHTTTACTSKMLEMLIPYMLKYEAKAGMEAEEEVRKRLFEKRGLKPDDWTMYAQQMLSEVFSPGILTPLEDSDEAFSLDAEMLEFTDIFDWLVTSDDDSFSETLDALKRQSTTSSSAPSLKYNWPPTNSHEMMLCRNSKVSWIRALTVDDIANFFAARLKEVQKGKEVEGEGEGGGEGKERRKEEGEDEADERLREALEERQRMAEMAMREKFDLHDLELGYTVGP